MLLQTKSELASRVLFSEEFEKKIYSKKWNTRKKNQSQFGDNIQKLNLSLKLISYNFFVK